MMTIRSVKLTTVIIWTLSTTFVVSGKHVLLMGGNGLMGAATAIKLIDKVDKMTILNRGNWYWDTAKTVKPYADILICDRMKSLTDCKDMKQLLQSDNVYFDALVDFSGFRREMVQDALQVLQGKIGRYIYISSDSVYEVCNKTHSRQTVEEDAVRPTDPDERRLFSERDIYGNRKMEGEEVLVEQRQEGRGIPYVSLRLPDVLGPRDNTHRWWLYQVWIRLSDYLDRPLSVPESLQSLRLSYVYSEDVADLVLYFLTADLDKLDEAYNFACQETPTLVELLHAMKRHLKSDVPVILDKSKHAMMMWPALQDEYDFPELTGDGSKQWPEALYLFPSTTYGPIDINKAIKRVDWQPTPFEKIVEQLAVFYEKAMAEDTSERSDIVRILIKRFSRDKTNVYRGLREVYGVHIDDNKDEL